MTVVDRNVLGTIRGVTALVTLISWCPRFTKYKCHVTVSDVLVNSFV